MASTIAGSDGPDHSPTSVPVTGAAGFIVYHNPCVEAGPARYYQRSFRLQFRKCAIAGGNTFALSFGAKSVTDPYSELGKRTDKSWAMLDITAKTRQAQLWQMMLNSNLCRAQANEGLLLAIGTPNDAVALSGITVGWQTLADQIDRYHVRGPGPGPVPVPGIV
jgi:hypothetical protein